MLLEIKPGKLDIKRREPGILFVFTLQNGDYGLIIDFRVDSMSST